MLVVEDRTDLRELFVALLVADGACVAQAGTGGEAVALACTQPFDVVLSDLGLPDVPGDLLVRQLVTTSVPSPVVVVISGEDEPQLAQARAAGAHAVFRKPVEWERITTCLRQQLARAA